MNDPLRVALGEVLYRSRGRHWDYAFLLHPEPLLREGWYTLHRRIFSNVEPSSVPLLLRGALGVGLGQPFLATAFTDAVRRDSQSRPIAHYLTWLGKSAEAAPGCSFGPQLVAALAPAIDAVFELTVERLRRGETKPLDALLQQRFSAALPARELELRGDPPGEIRWLGTIA